MIHKNLIIESVIPNQIVIEKLKISRDTINTMNASVFKLKQNFNDPPHLIENCILIDILSKYSKKWKSSFPKGFSSIFHKI